MESGSIASWNVAAGDTFGAGDVFCSVETDKATVDFEAQDDGVVAKLLVEAGPGELQVGQPIMVTVEEADDVAAFADFKTEAALPPADDEKKPAAAVTPVQTAMASSSPSILFPSARHLSESKGLDATVLSGSGKDGRVTKGDVLEAIQAGTLPTLPKKAAATAAPPPSPAPAPSPTPVSLSALLAVPVIETAGTFEDVPNNKMRKIIAKRLTESKSEVPHFYTSIQVQLDSVLKLRKKLVKDHDVKVSVNDFVIRCCALTLRDVPEVNATFNGQSTQLSDSIDISVAVATPTGLITPIVFGTDQLGLTEITSTVKDLALRARDGKLAPHEYQGGTFSISNLGMFGIQEFSAVINPPQAAILAVGGGARQVVPGGDGVGPVVQTLMTARLSADRRVVDEPTAALFAAAFAQYMSQPELLML